MKRVWSTAGAEFRNRGKSRLPPLHLRRPEEAICNAKGSLATSDLFALHFFPFLNSAWSSTNYGSNAVT